MVSSSASTPLQSLPRINYNEDSVGVRYVYLFGAFRAVFRVSGVAQVESNFAPTSQVLKKLLPKGKRIISEGWSGSEPLTIQTK